MQVSLTFSISKFTFCSVHSTIHWLCYMIFVDFHNIKLLLAPLDSELVVCTAFVIFFKACRSSMLCTAQLGGPVLKAFGRVQFSSFQLADKSPMITYQHSAGGSVSQLSQLAKLSPWLTLSTKAITTSFWHYNERFCFLSNQITGLYHFFNSIE